MEHSNNKDLWGRRFSHVDEDFFSGLNTMIEKTPDPVDLIHHFPIFTGHVNIGRFLALYEIFKKVQHLPGNYADVGTWKGASFLFIAKLIKIFEPQSFYQAHAFDWFEGMNPEEGDIENNYLGNYQTLLDMIKLQKLEDITMVHKLDLTKDLEAFSKDQNYGYLNYKYVFMDCGLHDVLENSIPYFWERLVPGGIMIFDHYATDVDFETRFANQLVAKGGEIHNFPFTRQPTAYVIKK